MRLVYPGRQHPGGGTGDHPMKHGLNAYQSGECRCEVCTEAKREYEGARVRRSSARTGVDCTYTREEIMRIRETE